MRQRYLGAAMTVISDGELHAMRRIQRSSVSVSVTCPLCTEHVVLGKEFESDW